MIVGAVVIVASNQALDSTSPPNLPRILFYAAVIAAVYFTLKSWPQRLAAFAGTASSACSCTRSWAPSGPTERPAR